MWTDTVYYSDSDCAPHKLSMRQQPGKLASKKKREKSITLHTESVILVMRTALCVALTLGIGSAFSGLNPVVSDPRLYLFRVVANLV